MPVNVWPRSHCVGGSKCYSAYADCAGQKRCQRILDAVIWYSPSPGSGLAANGIGLGLATLTLGTVAYSGAALYIIDEVINQVAADFPAINLVAPPVSAAQVLGENMLKQTVVLMALVSGC